MSYEELLEELLKNADEKYRVFQKKLLKNDRIQVIGVRVPILRKIANKQRDLEILSFPDTWYEVTFLKCCVVGRLDFVPFCENLAHVLPLIDNWATCDSFRAPCISQNREAFLPYLKGYLQDEREFVKRYALVTLLNDYMEEEYLPLIFSALQSVQDTPYYVMMAGAWLAAEVLVHFFDRGVEFLQKTELHKTLKNKVIQKARESFCLSTEQKTQLLSLKG